MDEKTNFCTPMLVFFCGCEGGDDCIRFVPVEKGEGVCKYFYVGADARRYCGSEKAGSDALPGETVDVEVYEP
jgi:hypothetical protein